MKNLIIGLCIFFSGLIIYNLGLLFGGVAILLTGLFFYLSYHRYQYILKLERYANQYENIWVISRHPITDEEIEVNEVFSDLVIFADYSEVRECVQGEISWFKRSGNPFCTDDNLSEEQRLSVKAAIFQDGYNINETWLEFQSRVIEEIKTDRKKRHAILKSANPDWYDKFGNNQKGVIWSK